MRCFIDSTVLHNCQEIFHAKSQRTQRRREGLGLRTQDSRLTFAAFAVRSPSWAIWGLLKKEAENAVRSLYKTVRSWAIFRHISRHLGVACSLAVSSYLVI